MKVFAEGTRSSLGCRCANPQGSFLRLSKWVLRMSYRKSVIIGASLIVCVGTVAWAIRKRTGVEFLTKPVERGAITYSVSATGTPNAVVNVCRTPATLKWIKHERP